MSVPNHTRFCRRRCLTKDPAKYGYELFETITAYGHQVPPINPKHKTIDGQTCYPSLADLPQIMDAVITAVKPQSTLKLLKLAPC
ncbi:MAG: CoA-binding protein [Planctomycetes bacterium]|nr:CoA-binding protein [Planctomycetota bacterium]